MWLGLACGGGARAGAQMGLKEERVGGLPQGQRGWVPVPVRAAGMARVLFQMKGLQAGLGA